MAHFSWLARSAVLAVAVAAGSQAAAQDAFTPSGTLRAFASEAELKDWFEPFAAERRRLEELRRKQEEEQRKRQEEARRKWESENPGKTWAVPRHSPPAPTAAPAPAGPAALSQSLAAESITNTQTAGVDEGGIVKVHGKHLVVLRRGRLFTINVERHNLAPVSSIEAFGPDVSPSGAWYDEMLVAGNTVVVIGYSYARGGTELGLFNIDDAGQLSYRGTYHLKSSDYYSSRNYASRLIGNRLILYTPIPISMYHQDPLARLPALRPWKPGAQAADFRPIAPPTRIYRTDEPLQGNSVTLHSIISCDLAQPQLQCEASGVLGGHGRVFYVSSTAVYVWAMQRQASALLLRLPLDDKAPSAIKTQGSPIDQFSFLEHGQGQLDVLVRANGSGDGMWRGERQGGNLSLLRLRVRDFGDGQGSAPAQAYVPLPAAGPGSLQNRFVGQHLLYGAGSGWGRPQALQSALHTYDLLQHKVLTVDLTHGVDRIEALGNNAVAIGSDGSNLVFSSVRLGRKPTLVDQYLRPAASQAETRSHGFFYKPESPTEGFVALPIRGAGEGGYRQLWEEPAAMLYLRSSELHLTEAGTLPARPGVGRNDGCRASCTDWYGNARPIFLGGRTFALMGYELVEGKVLNRPGGGRRMVELRRVSFAPGSPDYQQ